MKLHGMRKDINGWIYLSIYGGPHERGFAHGHLVAHELTQIMEMLEFFLYEEHGRTFAFFCEMADDLFEAVTSGKVKIRIDQRFPLEQVQQAHRDLEARKTTGCTILTL